MGLGRAKIAKLLGLRLRIALFRSICPDGRRLADTRREN
jgi:hypothetical protein